MSTWVFVNNDFYEAKQAKINIFDRGFLFGDSVFEVFITYNGKPFSVREHLERLRHSAEKLLIPCPYDDNWWKEKIIQLHSLSKNAESYFRIILSRGINPRFELDQPYIGIGALFETSVVIICSPLTVPDPKYYQNGIKLVTSHIQRSPQSITESGVKCSNYINNIMALEEARQKGGQEALFLDSHGFVAEGTTSNFFFVKNDKLFTPPLDVGILPGITRKIVFETADNLQIPVHEKRFSAKEMYEADEAFITSSIREVMPVTNIDDTQIAKGLVGTNTKKLMRGYKQAIPRFL